MLAAHAVGMLVVLPAFSVSVALARAGAARALRPLPPHMTTIAGILLVALGSYLAYYWWRIRLATASRSRTIRSSVG